MEVFTRPDAGPRIRAGVVIAAALVLLGALAVWAEFYRTEPGPTFASDEEHFLYGSIGAERSDGIPYWIWLVLPRIFPEYLPAPGGYAAIGVLAADGREMPIGFAKTTVGVERVGPNCALCHTGSYRLRPDDPRTIVPAAPAHQFAPQAYLDFLFACASDPRFTADTILQEISKNYRLGLATRLAYRFAFIPSTRRRLLRIKEGLAWTTSRPEWGAGRMDLFDVIRFGRLRQPVDQSIATADFPSLWNLGAHPRAAHFWDGSNPALDEAVLASAVGTDPDLTSLQRVQRFIRGARPPAYPLAVDESLASAGASVFEAQCASCHAAVGSRTGTPIPTSEVDTDARRAQAWTRDAAAGLDADTSVNGIKLSRFRATGGYAAVPLDGVWLRAPYLHNGSVPSLDDLLKPAADRPRVFWRGYDVFDPVGVGFVSNGAEAARRGTRFDTARPGNSNAGHEYGTRLAPADKRALLEYLKTL